MRLAAEAAERKETLSILRKISRGTSRKNSVYADIVLKKCKKIELANYFNEQDDEFYGQFFLDFNEQRIADYQYCESRNIKHPLIKLLRWQAVTLSL